jgi:ubiquinone/menaquinone biosynthesis C-methylase UbiE
MQLAMPAFLTRAAYHTQQASLRFPLLAAHAGLRLATARGKQPAPEDLRALQRAYFGLLEKDLRNAEAGLYPRSLLFQIPLTSYARKLPRLLTDLPRTYLRFRRRNYRDLPDDVDVARYPAYFRRTFHWQTDGYLSRRSAELYDLSVEFLFLGCADVMRRQVIPPLARVARRARGRRLRILDVGCGTGRTLAQIAAALPGHQYVGVDLSPFYLETARKELANVAEVTLLADNAEKLPFRDGYFDAVTSVYLFHELPRKARRRVAHEMARVLRPPATSPSSSTASPATCTSRSTATTCATTSPGSSPKRASKPPRRSAAGSPRSSPRRNPELAAALRVARLSGRTGAFQLSARAIASLKVTSRQGCRALDRRSAHA